MARQPNFLEADDSILEKNLKFVRNELEDDLEKFFGGSGAKAAGVQAPPRDFKVVTPRPGFCLKSFKVNTNEKYFVNVCQTEEIPPPEDITEEELEKILESDEPSTYRIPMSISEPRTTKDKSEKPVEACDIAINPQFFVKCEKSRLFKDFFLALISEALSEKYNIQLAQEKSIILNNRKYIGTLVQHRVRNNDVKTVLTSYKNPSEGDKQKLKQLEQTVGTRAPLVQEVNAKEVDELKNKSKLLNENAHNIKKDIAMAGSSVPDYKLRAKLNGSSVAEVQAEFYLPKCITSQEITMDIGEDRILLESMKHGYLFDKFLNYRLDKEHASAIFDKTNRMLQVRIPVFSQ